jgi:hypothetical protein
MLNSKSEFIIEYHEQLNKNPGRDEVGWVGHTPHFPILTYPPPPLLSPGTFYLKPAYSDRNCMNQELTMGLTLDV